MDERRSKVVASKLSDWRLREMGGIIVQMRKTGAGGGLVGLVISGDESNEQIQRKLRERTSL